MQGIFDWQRLNSVQYFNPKLIWICWFSQRKAKRSNGNNESYREKSVYYLNYKLKYSLMNELESKKKIVVTYTFLWFIELYGSSKGIHMHICMYILCKVLIRNLNNIFTVKSKNHAVIKLLLLLLLFADLQTWNNCWVSKQASGDEFEANIWKCYYFYISSFFRIEKHWVFRRFAFVFIISFN